MSAPDIGELRALAKTHNDAWLVSEATGRAFEAAVLQVLDGAFGVPERRHPVSWVNQSRRFMHDGVQVAVYYSGDRGLWHAQADVVGRIDDRVTAFADTPRAAVDQALAALAQTHPAEADALAAVVPKESTS